MLIRDATPGDVPAILGIYNHAVLTTTATADLEPQSLEARADWLKGHEGARLPVYVAEEGGQVLGWASLNAYKERVGYRFTVEDSIYIAEAHRGRGVGSKLLARLIDAAATLRCHAILAGIDGSNFASLRLHACAGFREVGRLREVVHKFDRWHDVIWMELLVDE